MTKSGKREKRMLTSWMTTWGAWDQQPAARSIAFTLNRVSQLPEVILQPDKDCEFED